ncbi:MAG: hypothetical protein M1169_02930 [Firmicutes bacterium]|nr:hypothetical protein [Bacillota bacterium]
MAKKVSLVDFVHALFKAPVVDICKKGEDYFIGMRLTDKDKYSDGREIIYTFDVQGLGTTTQILQKLGVSISVTRPYFKEGDKDLIAAAIFEDIKKKYLNWEKLVEENISFKKGGKGYS